MRLFIDDKSANIDDICTLIGIKKTEVPLHAKNRTFERLGVKNKRDVQNNKPILPRGHGIPCAINITTPDGDIKKVRYSESQKPITRHGVSSVLHTPLNLVIPGLELSVMENELNKFFFLYIHPYNKLSPLNRGKANPACVYEFVDTEKGAKEEQYKEDQLLEAMIRLKELDAKAIVQVAKGYKMPGVDDLTEAEVRQLLRAKLKVNPSQFILDLDGNEIAIEGIIQDAIDNKVITSRELGMANIYSIADREMCSVQKGANEVSAIRMIVESNLDVYMPLLQSGISAKNRESILKKPESNKYFDAFKGADKMPGETLNLTAEDQAQIAIAQREAEEVEKLRKWATQSLLDASVHTNTKKAIVANGEKILAQFRKDVEAKLIPEGTPEPIVVMPKK